MSASTRDQRVTVYAYEDAGSGGRVVARYVRLGTYWGRVEHPSGREVYASDAPELVADAVLALDESVAVPRRAIAQVTRRGVTTTYRVLATLERRVARELQLMAVACDAAQFTLADA